LRCNGHIEYDDPDPEKCSFDYCVVDESDPGNPRDTCASDMEELKQSLTENCLASTSASVLKAKQLNEANPNNCYTPVCNVGKCDVDLVEKPDEMKDYSDRCHVPVCKNTTVHKDNDVLVVTWSWVWEDSEEKNKCVSDECYDRECKQNDGCVATERCVVRSDECTSYKCEKDDAKTNGVTCKPTDLTVNFIHRDESNEDQCMWEECKNGHKVPVYQTCRSDGCWKGSCVNGYCQNKTTQPADVDICLEYSCDPDKDPSEAWSTVKRCVDDTYCTHDECWNYGGYYECHNDPIECGEKIDMTGFECFMPVCKEDDEAKTYRCGRKLIPNAYVDICGNCILDNPYEESTESSENTLTDCTNSPVKPMIAEGLAAASIALIIVGAIIIGSSITASSVYGTKTLYKFVKEASDQTAHSNPLFEGAENEMENPTYGTGQ